MWHNLSKYVIWPCVASLILAACAPKLSAPAQIEVATAIPTLDIRRTSALCDAVISYWDENWPTVIEALETLYQTSPNSCSPDIDIEQRLYNAYLAYGTELEAQGDIEAAQTIYERATAIRPEGEAARRIARLRSLSTRQCISTDSVQNTLPAYEAHEGAFIKVNGRHFVLDGNIFSVRGVNYYPMQTPFHRFLRETPLEVFGEELELIAEAGINTLRVFVDNEALFACEDGALIPVDDAFGRLDTLLQEAAKRALRVILVLNHVQNPNQYALYDAPPYALAQLQFIIERYKDEPYILAWDLRDGGDRDYQSGTIEKTAVLNWLFETAVLVKTIDEQHLITAGWHEDSIATTTAVDFISLHYSADIEPFRQLAAYLTDQTEKPLFLAGVGYSTFTLDETAQRSLLFQLLEAAELNQFAGWAIWTAFDYPLTATCLEPNCPSEDSPLHHYGLWNTSYFPKLALDAVQYFIDN